MHYEVKYEGEAARERALQDCRNWLGDERWNLLNAQFAQMEPLTREQFGLMCSFAGIQGYPVTVWYDSLWPVNTIETAAAHTAN